jgi:hypothetical protein
MKRTCRKKRHLLFPALKPLPLSSPQNVDQSSCPYYSRNFERGSVRTPLSLSLSLCLSPSLCLSLQTPPRPTGGRLTSLSLCSKPSQTHRADCSLSVCAPNPSETHKAGWQLSTCEVRGGIIDSRPGRDDPTLGSYSNLDLSVCTCGREVFGHI